MKVLTFGPSGAGKTYVSAQLGKLGYPAYDADLIDGLSSWYDGDGNQVTCPDDADAEFLDNHSFLWNRDFLSQFLVGKVDVYLFGSAGNIADMFELFDRVYFLKVQPEMQKDRLQHESRENPMGSTEFQRESAVEWGTVLEKIALENQVAFIDASLSPLEILDAIS